MKTSRKWLQKYFDEELPPTPALAEALTFHAAEIGEVREDFLDVKILPDRAPYLFSHRGIAHEFSAILSRPMKGDPFGVLPPTFPEAAKVLLSIDDPHKCRRHIGALVCGVKVGPSPKWLREALEAVGQRSINNVVDATNYVMLDLGQPLHAFDAGKLAQKNGAYHIRVRGARPQEKIKLLSGEESELPEGVLVIADDAADKALDVAGIKGGETSSISTDTTDLFVSVANFDGTTIRKASQALKLWTDASRRFQNNISPAMPAYGMKAILNLIQEIAGGSVEGVVDVYPRPVKAYRVGVSVEEVNAHLGSKFSKTEVEDVFRRLALSHAVIADPLTQVLALAREQEGKPYKENASVLGDAPNAFDCSSFVSWLFVEVGIRAPRISIDQYVWGTPVKKEDLVAGDLIFFSTPTSYVWKESQDYLPGTQVPEGVSHVALYLGDGKMIHAHGGEDQKVVVHVIENYHLKDKIVGYRRPQGLTHERFVVTVPFERVDLRIKEDLIEEVGRIIGYEKIDAQELPVDSAQGKPDQSRFRGIERMKDSLVAEGFTEVSTQSFAKKGDIVLANPLDTAKPFLRTTLEDNLKDALAQAKQYAPLVLAPGQKPKLFEVGTVFPKEGEFVELRMTESVSAWGENFPTHDNLSIAKLEDYGKDYEPKTVVLGAYRPFSIYPFVLRDIALWCPAGTESSAIEKILRENGGNLLARADQFDRFEKEGRVSYAFRLVFESMERTLTDNEVNAVMEKISAALAAAGYQVR